MSCGAGTPCGARRSIGSGCTGGGTALGTGGAAEGIFDAGIGIGIGGADTIEGGIARGCGTDRVTVGPILFLDSSSTRPFV